VNLIEITSRGSELPTEFEQSVSDQLKSLVEDIWKAFLFKVSCFAEETENILKYLLLCNYPLLFTFVLMSLMLSSRLCFH